MSQADQDDTFDAAFAEFATPSGAQMPAPGEDDASAEPALAAPAEPNEALDQPQPAGPSPEDLQRQLEDARHRERSSANRVSAFARENNQLRSSVDEMRKKLDELLAAKAAPAPAAAPADEDDVLDNAPDLNAAVRKRVMSATAGLESTVADLRKKVEQAEQAAAQANQRLQPIISREDRKQHEEVWNGLDERFTKSWRDDIKAQDFEGWLQSQRPEIQSIYSTANTVEDSASVLTLYYASKGRSAPTSPAASQPATNANTERLRRAAGVAPRGNTRPPTGPAPDDFEGNFAAFSQALRQA